MKSTIQSVDGTVAVKVYVNKNNIHQANIF